MAIEMKTNWLWVLFLLILSAETALQVKPPNWELSVFVHPHASRNPSLEAGNSLTVDFPARVPPSFSLLESVVPRNGCEPTFKDSPASTTPLGIVSFPADSKQFFAPLTYTPSKVFLAFQSERRHFFEPYSMLALRFEVSRFLDRFSCASQYSNS